MLLDRSVVGLMYRNIIAVTKVYVELSALVVELKQQCPFIELLPSLSVRPYNCTSLVIYLGETQVDYADSRQINYTKRMRKRVCDAVQTQLVVSVNRALGASYPVIRIYTDYDCNKDDASVYIRTVVDMINRKFLERGATLLDDNANSVG